jgi:hypothetical protein
VIDLHPHSFEESFYGLEGSPTLVLDGRARASRGGKGSFVGTLLARSSSP